MTSGGLGFTHSMDLFTSIAFKAPHQQLCGLRSRPVFEATIARGAKAYLAIPFVEEMRVLTDWTITRSLFGGDDCAFICV